LRAEDFVLGVDQAEFGHQLSLADADWPTASGGEQPVAVGERIGAIDPFPTSAIF
jgi:hypothetical protein